MYYFSIGYKEEGKRNFRPFTHKRKSGNRQSGTLLALWATVCMFPSVTLADSGNKQDASELVAWTQAQIAQEIAGYASRQQWSDYHTEISISVPASVDHLPACDTALYISAADQQSLPVGYLRRQLECQSGPQPWKLNITAQVSIRLPVIVSATHIRRDTRLTAAMLKSQVLTLSRNEAFATRPEQLIGQRTLRRVRSGQIINPLQLQPLWLVEEGDAVVIVASKNGLEASMKGEALQNGVKGEQVSVRNISSGKVIQALVTERGKVETIF